MVLAIRRYNSYNRNIFDLWSIQYWDVKKNLYVVSYLSTNKTQFRKKISV